MKIIKTLPLMAAVLACAFMIADEARADVFSSHPWLADASPFVQNANLSTRPGATSLGAFGIGNGRMFALQGVEYPQNKLTNIVGPKYEKSEEEQFVPVWHSLSYAGGAAEFKQSRVYRVKGTSIIVCEETTPGVQMRTVTFAPPDDLSIIRIVTVANTGAEALKDAGIVIEARGLPGKASPFEDRGMVWRVAGRRMVISAGAGAKPGDGGLVAPLGNIAPGGSAEAVISITIQDDSAAYSIGRQEKENAGALLDDTRRWWADWFAGALSVESSDAKLAGMFESILALLKVEQSEENSLISPMGKYSGFWCRDNYGPLLLLLPAGKFTDARKSLEYFDLATRLDGFRNRYPLDMDISKAPENPDWNSMAPQQGDDPAILVIEFYTYWLATGDSEFVKKHYGFMRRNILGQNHGDFRLPFNGDETYQVYIMMAESAPMRDFFTPASGFFHAVAAGALAEMAAAIGETADAETLRKLAAECRKKTEEYYWKESAGFYIPYVKKADLKPTETPFGDINLAPLWIGYGDASDSRQRTNAINSAKKLMNSRGTAKSTAKCALYTGMLPGMLLYNLKAVGILDKADEAYAGLMNRVMSPAGEFAEGYDSRDKWINYGSAPTVYRPWESGINAQAVLYYVTGLERSGPSGAIAIQPHLPPGVEWVKFDNLYAGPDALSLEIRRDGDRLSTAVANKSSASLSFEALLEPVAGLSPPAGAVEFDSAAYARKLWKVSFTLAPGEKKTF